MSPKVVDEVLSQLTTKYGKVSPLTVSKVQVNNYLDMRFGYNTKGKVRITMPKHIEVILEEAEKDMDIFANTPASNHLLQVQEDGSTLLPVQADLFQTLVSKILFVSCRSRPDPNMALAFLTIQFRNPDED